MGTRLVDTNYEVVTYSEALQYVNSQSSTTYTDLSLAVIGLGISLVCSLLGNKLGEKIATALNAAALSLGVSALAAEIESRISGDSGMRNAISQLDYPGFIMITTKLYEYSSASGNSWTWWTENTYEVNN